MIVPNLKHLILLLTIYSEEVPKPSKLTILDGPWVTFNNCTFI